MKFKSLAAFGLVALMVIVVFTAVTSDSALFTLLAVILLGAAAVFVFENWLAFKGDR